MIATASPLTLDDLSRIPVGTPRQGAGADWKGVPHHDLISALRGQFHRSAYEVGALNADVSRSGKDIAAGWTVFKFADVFKSAKIVPGFGVTASNDTRSRLRFYAGIVLPEEGASVVYGTFRGGWYDQTFDLQEEAKAAVRTWTELASKGNAVAKSLRSQPIDNALATTLLFEAGRKQLMPGSRVFRVEDQFRRTGDGSAWGLLVAFGRVCAVNPPDQQLKQLFGFYQLVTGQDSTHPTDPTEATAAA